MLHAYLDESGIHESAAICVIGGYFAGKGQWRRFETAWRKLLADFSVPLGEFHASELIAKQGFFFAWSRTRLNEFLNALAATIASHTKIHPVGASIVKITSPALGIPRVM